MQERVNCLSASGYACLYPHGSRSRSIRPPCADSTLQAVHLSLSIQETTKYLLQHLALSVQHGS